MASVIMVVLLLLPFHFCNAYKRPNCDAKVIARRLGYSPDAWKLIADEHPRYRLMFHSNGSLDIKYKCLCTTTSRPYPSDNWKRTVKYHTSPNSTTTLHGANTVWSNKSDQFYVYDNVLITLYYTMLGTSKDFFFKHTMIENEVIYENKYRCILMRSKELDVSRKLSSIGDVATLGYIEARYLVWVHTAYYETKKTIPYDCVLFYEACTAEKKIWVYKDCPTSEYCLRSDQEPSTGNN